MTTLGEREWQAGWRVRCVPKGIIHLGRMAQHIISLARMNVDGEPDIRTYPTETGAGGQGIQIYQPLVESWLVIGTWPELGFIRVNLSSCLPFDVEVIQKYLELHGVVERATWRSCEVPHDPGPCWPQCKEMLLKALKSEIDRIDAILLEREKATELLAMSEVTKATMVILDKIEERVRGVEMARGALDAQMYLIILGLPVIVSAAVAVFMAHLVK